MEKVKIEQMKVIRLPLQMNKTDKRKGQLQGFLINNRKDKKIKNLKLVDKTRREALK